MSPPLATSTAPSAVLAPLPADISPASLALWRAELDKDLTRWEWFARTAGSAIVPSLDFGREAL
jgi:hypothetical protein